MSRPRPSGRPPGLKSCARGIATVEFALVAPVFFLLLMGIFDLAHMTYAKAVLHGAVQTAARTSSLETANTADADAQVEAAVHNVIPSARVESSRTSYFDFADIGRAEPMNDRNNNGTCEDGETYTDQNRNGQWDADVGQSDNGGANDVVIYTVTVTYTPLFPVPFTTLSDGEREISASAVKKNQPFATQQAYGSDVGTCS